MFVCIPALDWCYKWVQTKYTIFTNGTNGTNSLCIKDDFKHIHPGFTVICYVLIINHFKNLNLN